MKCTHVKSILRLLVLSVTACVVSARPGVAQNAPGPPSIAAVSAGVALPSTEATSAERGSATGFLRDVGSDYVHFFSKENAVWLGAGGLAALAVHAADEDLSEWAQDENPSLTGGAAYGSQFVQVPVAIVIWAVGAAAGSGRVADTGRDLLRAQISVVSWTYAIKIATDRTRPNGDPRSFPSGHASTSFATAVVLQEHFGWKLGLPAFAAASYAAASRVGANKHWASDVAFGAFLGMASGRTVTIHVRENRISIAPWVVPGGGGVQVSALEAR